MTSKRQYPIDQSNQLVNQQQGLQGQQPLPYQPQQFQTQQPNSPYEQQQQQQQWNQQQQTPIANIAPQQQQQSISPTQVNGVMTPQQPSTNTPPVHSGSKRVYPVDPQNEAVLSSNFSNMNLSQQQQQQQQPLPQPTHIPVPGPSGQSSSSSVNSYNPYNQQPQQQQQQQPQQQWNTSPNANNTNTQPINTFTPMQPTQQQQTNYNYNQQPQPAYNQPMQPQQQQQQVPFQPMQPVSYTQQTGQQFQQPQIQTPQQQAAVEAPIPTAENLCPKSYMRLSMNAIPNHPSVLNKVHIPLGLNIHPLAHDNQNPVPVVYSAIIRCRRCRTYINPFVTWLNGGGRWRCNMCENINDTPQDYFSPIDFTTGKRSDILNRPELQRGCVEFLASSDYLVRAPQPPTYFFIIDVCYESIVSGMLNTAINAIKTTLTDLIEKSMGRARFGIMTFDDSLQFFNLKSNASNRPQMFVVSDVDQVYVPPFEDFLVNLKDNLEVVENTLNIIQSMPRTQQKVESCLGSALKAAFSICERVGGKLIVMQSYIPRGPLGKLSVREYQPLIGTKKEVQLLQPSSDGEFYKELALSCTSQQLSVDLFLFSADYTDTASLGTLCQITGGSMYYYPSFVASRDGQVFAANLIHSLTRDTAWEAVMRVRSSRGLTINSYHGNYFLKTSDLLGLPTIDSDKTITLQLGISDSIGQKYASLQSALLYTHSCGERRVRVFTISIPIVTNYQDLFRYADISVVTSLISKMAIDKALSSSLSDARDAIANKCVEILQAFKAASAANPQAASAVTLSQNAPKLLLPETLKHLPLYVVAMVKNIIFSSRPTHPDLRSFHMQRMKTLDLNSCLNFFYPYFYSLLTPPNYQPPTSQDTPFIPHSFKLSSDELSRNGLFAIVNGYTLYIFIGESVPEPVFVDIFGYPSSQLDVNTFQDLPILDNENNRYARKIIELVRNSYPDYLKMFVVRSNDKIRRPEFQSLLIEDRTPEGCSYYEFIIQLQSRIQQS